VRGENIISQGECAVVFQGGQGQLDQGSNKNFQL